MKQSTRDYFTNKRWAYDYMISQECVPTAEKGMPGEIYNLIREDFDPGYENDTQCPPCAFSIVKHGFYLFDQAVKDEKLIVHATFPKQEPIIQISSDQGETWIEKPIQMYTIETPEAKKARLADPNRIIKRRAKRK